ncbi:MAG TPA: serine/threonine-protein kinase [Kofleriaceae bacterium]|nr:serine/threonine-protein kinase [Kofleriaceae bacterium]
MAGVVHSRDVFVRPSWSATSEEESRHQLQARLTTLFKIMFWAFVLLIGAQALLWEVLYKTEPYRPIYQDQIYVIAVAALTLLAVIWRLILIRRELTMRQLYWLEMFFATGCGTVLGSSAVLAYNFTPSQYVCLIYGMLGVFTRAIVVPSSGRWTAIVSSATFAPMAAAALILGVSDVPLSAPAPLYVAGAWSLEAITVLLASIGSRIIYGLRRRVSAAMQIGQYKVERRIEEGGMGQVFLASHVLLRRPTAIKLLRPERVGADNLERFEREVRHMSQLTHPNTVAVFDYGRSAEGIFYYAMEYLGSGINLEALVAMYGKQPAGRVVQILIQVCGALQEAHAKQFLHRDVKPGNIILCERGGMPDVAKVVDFGLAAPFEDHREPGHILLGTPAYIAPEVITGSGADATADLYALGAVAYFLLSGRRVFDGASGEVLGKHVSVAPTLLSEHVAVAPALEAIVMKCLAKKPADRYQSATELAAALRALPAATDWSDDDARCWWLERQRSEAAAIAASAQPTLTITVDLAQR